MFDSKSQSVSQYSRLRIRKPTGCTLNSRFLTFSMKNLKDGPSNDRFFIAQSEYTVKKDKNNNFEPSPNSDLFLSVQTFGVASLVRNMYEKDMQDLKDLYLDTNERFNHALHNWTNRRRIGIFIDDKPDPGVAYYRRTLKGGELHFSPFWDDEFNKWVRSSEIFDIIAHETGHSILDNLRPKFRDNDRQQTKGLHESFGDWTILFTILCIPELREELLKVTGGDLHKKSFFSIIVEEFNHRNGLRNADIILNISEVGCEEHDLSQVFTGAIYDILAKSFNKLQLIKNRISQDFLLSKVNKDLRHLFLKAFIEVPYSNPSFSDIGHMMEIIAARDNLGYIHKYIREAFSKRGLDISGAHESDQCGINQPPKTVPVPGSDLSPKLYSQLKVEDNFKHDKGKYLDKKPNLQQIQPTKAEYSNDDAPYGTLRYTLSYQQNKSPTMKHYNVSDQGFEKKLPIPLGQRSKAEDDLNDDLNWSFQEKPSLKQDQSKRKGNYSSRPFV